MIYPTVRQGQIKFSDDVNLPENSTLLITVLENHDAFDTFTLGEHLVAGLEDALSGQVIETATTSDLERHLDTVFNEA